MHAAFTSALILALAAVTPSSVHAHGQMMEPKPRSVSTKYRADAGALRQAGESELQWSPLEQLSQRKQADQPQAPTFDVMNGCRGMVYESGNPVTALTSGSEFPIKWFIQAPHPGYGEFNIVKPKTGAGGKIMYEKVVTLKRLEPFGTDGGNFDTTATIPTSVTGCEKAGDCALQMYWHSDIANQTYPTCSDITISGSGVGAAGGSRRSLASDGPKADADTDDEIDTSATVSLSVSADGNDEYKTPVATKNPATPTTPAPTAASTTTTTTTSKTPAPTATTTKKSKCRAKIRSLRQ